jgi:hypothetical protein
MGAIWNQDGPTVGRFGGENPDVGYVNLFQFYSWFFGEANDSSHTKWKMAAILKMS